MVFGRKYIFTYLLTYLLTILLSLLYTIAKRKKSALHRAVPFPQCPVCCQPYSSTGGHLALNPITRETHKSVHMSSLSLSVWLAVCLVFLVPILKQPLAKCWAIVKAPHDKQYTIDISVNHCTQ